MPTNAQAIAANEQQHEMVVGPGFVDVGLAVLDDRVQPRLEPMFVLVGDEPEARELHEPGEHGQDGRARPAG